ncbi:WSC-domain-containing protein [Massarina eburnea CBS 473.64]|uniref:WSC-domain-containing protein n=1 Tax=Massarina eburnea CBS 473.64 TaxID=1395130 RepID=A0A6A6RR22_9PLEO|nr:WSC-domain-containing protein [Massarina eburnea CBS 473.64]
MRYTSTTLIAAVLPCIWPFVATATSWHYEGCYTDTVGLRTLRQNFFYSSNGMSIEACEQFCEAGGYSLAGIEYSDECYCDTTLRMTASQADGSTCFMPCSGNTSEVCGGPNRLSIYSTGSSYPTTNDDTVNGYAYVGCVSDSVAARTLSSFATVEGGADAMTVSACIAACKAQGHSYAGVEYGGECWCDDQLEHGAGLIDQALCSSPCRGNFSEYCGGSNALNVYAIPSVATLSR